ncbi:hypothetical protein [Thermosipho atlanticus]|uniref:Uncharacterized protein n=1 Tax=Thermosipho atlanticus DSM 15807 TaxID=1123380 RepID=A0A1M5TG10_9BACT|nr:hypothetical protein [Thermosipho atlanticus]SHH49639.1 hypothetical protein SAMN02745199_1287 [Thermosipho atlanticus DSM 15807]
MKKVIFLLTLILFSISVFANFVNFWVDPFFQSYGFSISQSMSFWKINALLRYSLETSWKQGFAFVIPKTPEIQFELFSERYAVEYGSFHKDIPFSTFVNPYSEGLNLKWGFIGFYGNYQYFFSNNIDFMISKNFVNLGLKFGQYNFFIGKNSSETALGIDINGFVIYLKDSIKMGLNLKYKDSALFLLPFDKKLGFVLRNKDNYLFLTDKEVTVFVNWGQLGIYGKFQKDFKSFRIEFPVW